MMIRIAHPIIVVHKALRLLQRSRIYTRESKAQTRKYVHSVVCLINNIPFTRLPSHTSPYPFKFHAQINTALTLSLSFFFHAAVAVATASLHIQTAAGTISRSIKCIPGSCSVPGRYELVNYFIVPVIVSLARIFSQPLRMLFGSTRRRQRRKNFQRSHSNSWLLLDPLPSPSIAVSSGLELAAYAAQAADSKNWFAKMRRFGTWSVT